MEEEQKKRIIDIIKNLNQSIKKADQRPIVAFKNNLTTPPSAQAASLKRKRDSLMKQYEITKEDLK